MHLFQSICPCYLKKLNGKAHKNSCSSGVSFALLHVPLPVYPSGRLELIEPSSKLQWLLPPTPSPASNSVTEPHHTFPSNFGESKEHLTKIQYWSLQFVLNIWFLCRWGLFKNSQGGLSWAVWSMPWRTNQRLSFPCTLIIWASIGQNVLFVSLR